MSLLLLLKNRTLPTRSISTKDYNIWDQETIDADAGPQQQKTVEATIQNQLGFLVRKTWRTPTPVGCIMQYVGNNAPIGWLFCDGTAYSRSEYSDLFAIIDVTYGVGNGSTTFNVPNFTGRVPVGAGTINDGTGTYVHDMGDSSGETYHTLTIDEMPTHNHNITTYNDDFNSNSSRISDGPSFSANYDSASAQSKNLLPGTSTKIINDTGSGLKHNNMQPYVVVRYIIKW